jgi:hypothetical protein
MSETQLSRMHRGIYNTACKIFGNFQGYSHGPRQTNKSMGIDNTQAQKHIHSKSLSRINLGHNWCNESTENVGNIQTVKYVTLSLVDQICR